MPGRLSSLAALENREAAPARSGVLTPRPLANICPATTIASVWPRFAAAMQTAFERIVRVGLAEHFSSSICAEMVSRAAAFSKADAMGRDRRAAFWKSARKAGCNPLRASRGCFSSGKRAATSA